MEWTKVDQMFPNGGVYSTRGFLTNQEILKSDLDKIELIQASTARDMVTKIEKIIYFPNGNLLRYYEYNIYPKDQIEKKSTLNDFGQKIFFDIIQKGE